MKKHYPSNWYRVEQRGCTPNGVGCQHLDWPIERQDLSRTKTATRHVVPKNVLAHALSYQLDFWETLKADNEWIAVGKKTQRRAGVKVIGRTEREAMQNLCAEMRVTLP